MICPELNKIEIIVIDFNITILKSKDLNKDWCNLFFFL